MNKRMIFYILGKMMGVEGIVPFDPGICVPSLSGEKWIFFSDRIGSPDPDLILYWEEKNQSQSGSTVKRDLRS